MFLLTLATVASAQAEVVPVIELRPRFEARSWSDADPDAAEWWMSERARVGLDVRSERLSVKAVVQDVRLWGEELDTGKDFSAGGLDLHEGVATWKADHLTLAFGRQEIGIEEERLVGPVNWSQSGRAFDAVRLSGANGQLSFDAIGILLQHGVDGDGGAAILRGGWSTDAATVDLLAIGDRDPVLDRARATAGVYAKGTSGALSGRVEGYAQVGEIGDDSIVAYMAGAQATVAPDTALHPRITVLFDRLSGDPDVADGVNAGFDTLWATNHKFYGVADVVGPSDRGLNDLGARIRLGTDTSSATVEVHGYQFAAPRDAEPWIGEELSLVSSRALGGGLTLDAGAAVVHSGAANDAWGFVMLTAKPDLNAPKGKKP